MALAIKHTVPAKRGKGDVVYIAFYFIRGAFICTIYSRKVSWMGEV